MDLIEFMNTIFVPDEYAKVPDKVKKAPFYGFNRFIANKYPIEVNMSNNLIGMNRDHIPKLVDWWQRFLYTRHRYKPDWFYWKTSLAKADKSITDKFTKEVLNGYKNLHKISSSQFSVMLEIFPEETVSEIEVYRKSLEFYTRKKPTKK